MSRFFAQRLAILARKKLTQFQPQIVGVTGSVGKTSTREAIAAALRGRFRVRTPYKNYNNELGLPLAILGEQSPGRDVWGWLKLFARARKATLPEYLVLEYGAEHPGDIGYLKTVAQPNVAVITAISPVHVENYPSFEALVEEKASLADGVAGAVVLNADDPIVALMANRYPGVKIITYGYSERADIRAEEVQVEVNPLADYRPGADFCRLRAQIILPGGERGDLLLTNSLADTQVHSCLAAIAVAQHYDIPLQPVLDALREHVQPVAGRLRPLAGIKGSLILDDSYNAAPASMAAGLKALRNFGAGQHHFRRVAVLGDMAELGSLTEREHRSIGQQVAESAQVFIGVGPKMNFALESARAANLPPENLHWCATSDEAGVLLDRLLQPGDVVLIKGSQSRRMEKVVKAVMAEPARAQELLVRQEEQWL